MQTVDPVITFHGFKQSALLQLFLIELYMLDQQQHKQ